MKKWLGIVGVMAVTLTMTGCLKDSGSSSDASGAAYSKDASGPSIAEIKQVPFSKDKVYKIAVDADYLPMGYEENGEVRGFSTELFQLAAQKAGIKYDIKALPFDQVFKMVEDGDIDVIAASASITPERERDYAFSDAYFISGAAILVKKDSGIKDFNDLIKKGVKVAVEKGTSSNTTLSEVKGVNVEDIYAVAGGAQEATDLVKNGKADAAYGELPIYNYQVSKNPDLKVIEDTIKNQADFFGFLSRKSEKELLDKINYGLNQARIDGSYVALYEKYFGKEENTKETAPTKVAASQ